MSVLDRIDGQGGCMASGERHGHWVRFRLGEVQAIPKLQVHGAVLLLMGSAAQAMVWKEPLP